LGFFLPAIF